MAPKSFKGIANVILLHYQWRHSIYLNFRELTSLNVISAFFLQFTVLFEI